MSQNFFVGDVDPIIKALSGTGQTLTRLDMAVNFLNGNVPLEIGLLTNLGECYIAGLSMSGLLPIVLSIFPPSHPLFLFPVIHSCPTQSNSI